MIFVNRSGAPSPETVAAINTLGRTNPKNGQTELDRARIYYTQNPLPNAAFNFGLYRDQVVCAALDRLYHDKCAYCESIYHAAGVRNIEHFRPKGKITEEPGHPGYWWLGSSWENLAPSCPSCNQYRYNMVFEPGMSMAKVDRLRSMSPNTITGKACHFPLHGSGIRARNELDNLNLEDPLLIDPSVRDPENHLRWIFEWDRTSAYIWNADPLAAYISARVHAGNKDPYGEASVEIYGLNRLPLFRARITALKQIQRSATVVARSLTEVAIAKSADLPRLTEHLREDYEALQKNCADDQPYAAMGRAFVTEFESELRRRAAAPI